MKTQQEYIEQGEQYILKTYNRFPVVLEKGEGVYLYDADQKKYLDFGAGIAVFALGYGNEAYNQALKDQIDKLIHTSNLYYNIPAVEAAKKIVDASGLKKVFFTNSGTEAIEGALKVARKYAYNKDDSKDYEFIAMNHSFHGRSQGALSVTGNSHYQDGFVPKEFRAVFAEFNNLEDVVSKITDKTCGIICEVVQGEGGIFPADKEFLEGLRKVCDEKDILLIFDEIQCGMGRCGSLFAHDLYGVKPDVLTLAKALGCGVPVGAFVVGEKADGALVPGDHGTTYGGNPFAAAAINAVFDQFEKLQVPEHAKIGDKISCFVYKDSEDRPIATVHIPKITLGAIRPLRVKEVSKIGAFLDWGLEKDLFLPFKEQLGHIRPNKEYLVSLYIDKSDRLCATMKIGKLLSTDHHFKVNDWVHATVYNINPDHGAFVAVEDQFLGRIPKREIHNKIVIGEQLNLRVTKVNEDGKLSLSLIHI